MGDRREGASRASRVFGRKMQAQVAGQATARRLGADHVIHRADGTFAGRHRYA
jgi:hypothetical protein